MQEAGHSSARAFLAPAAAAIWPRTSFHTGCPVGSGPCWLDASSKRPGLIRALHSVNSTGPGFWQHVKSHDKIRQMCNPCSEQAHGVCICCWVQSTARSATCSLPEAKTLPAANRMQLEVSLMSLGIMREAVGPAICCQNDCPGTCAVLTNPPIQLAYLHLSHVSMSWGGLPRTSSMARSTFQVRGGAQGRASSSPAAPVATDLTTS